MTWDDFKKYVDEKLSEFHEDEDIEIGLIDISLLKVELTVGEIQVAVDDENSDGRHKLVVYN
jgi:hypothetical protein